MDRSTRTLLTACALALTTALAMAAALPATAAPTCPASDAAPVAVTGTVADDAAHPVPGVSVTFRCDGFERTVTTGPDGAFRAVLPTGRYQVETARAAGDVVHSDAVEITDGSSLQLALPPATVFQAIEVIGRSPEEVFADRTFAVTKTEIRLLDLPQSVSMVTKEVIEDQNLQRLNEIAPYVAGVNEFSVYDDLTIRGFRNYDDRRVNGMRTYNNFWSQQQIAHLERVEVVKGPASATFGAASPGGTINLVTKKPLPFFRNEVSADVGSFDSRSASLDTNGLLRRDGTVLYRLNLAYEDSGSFRERYFNEGLLVAPSVSWLPNERTRLNLDVVYGQNDSVLDRGQPAIDGGSDLGQVPIERMVTQPGDRFDTESTSFNLSLEQRLGGSWTMAASHMEYQYDEKLVEHRFESYLSPSLIELRFANRDNEADVSSSSAYVLGIFETGAVTHALTFGADRTNRTDGAFDRSARDVGIFDLLEPDFSERDTSAYNLRESTWGGELDTVGYYAQDQISWGDWEVLVGLRYEDFETTPLGEPAQQDTSLVPRLGVVYSLGDSRSVYASWIEGFEPPDSWVNTTFYGGPFSPMQSRLFEVGYKHLAFGDRLLLTTSLYEIERDDVIVWANDSANPDLYRQRGQERSRGFELEANGRVTDRLTLMANYAYNEAEITEDTIPELIGLTKENAPRHSATVWGRYDLGTGLGVGAGLSYVGERETFDRSLVLPDYLLLNAAIYYDLPSGVRLTLLAKNLTDETHWTSGYYFGRVFPGEPRSVELGASYRF